MQRWISLVLSNVTVAFFVLGLVAAVVVVIRRRSIRPSAVAEAFLSTFVVFSVGFSYLCNFVLHVFFGAIAARHLGWAASPFQAEVGFASLGFAMVGFFAARQSAGAGARVAAILGPSLFVLGAAAGPVRQMIVAHHFSPANAGTIFWSDVLFPVVGAVLLAARYGMRGGARVAHAR